MNTQTGTLWGVPLAVMMPWLMQFAAVVGLVVFVIVRDGVTTQQIITALETVALGNLVAGGVLGGAHVIGSGLSAGRGTTSTPANAPAATPQGQGTAAPTSSGIYSQA